MGLVIVGAGRLAARALAPRLLPPAPTHTSGLRHGHVHGEAGTRIEPHAHGARCRRSGSGSCTAWAEAPASASCCSPRSTTARSPLAALAVVRALHRALDGGALRPASASRSAAGASPAIVPRIAPVLAVTSLVFGVWYALGALDVAPYYLVDGGRSPLARGARTRSTRSTTEERTLRGAPRRLRALPPGARGLRGSGLKLAYGAAGPTPPPELKERILAQARGERAERRLAPGSPAQLDRATRGRRAGIARRRGDRPRRLDRNTSERGSALAACSPSRARRSSPWATAAPSPWLRTARRPWPLRVRRRPSGKTYEAWVIRGGKATPAGTLPGQRRHVGRRGQEHVPARLGRRGHARAGRWRQQSDVRSLSPPPEPCRDRPHDHPPPPASSRELAHLSDESLLLALVASSDDNALAELYRPLRRRRLRPRAPDPPRRRSGAGRRAGRIPRASGARPTASSAERAKASTWILTLVHRRAVDLVRREDRRRADPLEPRPSPPHRRPVEDEATPRLPAPASCRRHCGACRPSSARRSSSATTAA